MLNSLTLVLALAGNPAVTMEAYLQRAVERGVPLFNGGSAEACAAVYATALEGIAASDGWGLDDGRRASLGLRLELAAAIEAPGERAWAYRGLIDALLAGEAIEAPELAGSAPLFDFSEPREVDRWRVVVDGVMGGLSTGAVAREDDRLVFTGETSLRNNGGFSSIRAPVPAGAVAGYDAFRLRVKGDGRTYIFGASRGTGRADSYWTRFETTAGEWQTVTVPVSDMVRQYFGNPVPGRLQASGVRGVEFYIYDKQAGPFRLEVAQIEAVRAGSS